MGQALYRKYRSRSLNDLIGQEHITTSLQHALDRNQLAHAYLFTGPRGVGKTSVARILAHAVNEVPYDNDEAQYLDIIEIDAASNNSVEDVRDLREKVHIAPTNGKYKVYIIDEVHMLSKAAFNALLKTLEEPPAHVIFILATTEPHKLPETIVSRTQRYTFRLVDTAKVEAHLRNIAKLEKITIDDKALAIIAAHGEGSLRDSIGLLDQVSHTDEAIDEEKVLELLGNVPTERIADLMAKLQTAQPGQMLVALEGMLLEGYNPVRIAQQLARTIREEVFIAQTVAWSAKPTLDLLEQLMQVPAAINPEISLELALLSSMNYFSRTVPAETEIEQEITVIPEVAPELDEVKEPATVANTTAEETEMPLADGKSKPKKQKTTELDDSFWPQLLEAVKRKHNTLYSVLRMAKPEWHLETGRQPTLILHCRFAFHQKQLTEPKNHQILLKIVEELSGQKTTIRCDLQEVKPGKSNVGKAKETEAADDSLTTVSNIFGGAELLES